MDTCPQYIDVGLDQAMFSLLTQKIDKPHGRKLRPDKRQQAAAVAAMR